MLHVGDLVDRSTFSDLPNSASASFEERVKGDGTITLLQNQDFQAAGKTRGAAGTEIRERYVPAIFKNMTVTIKPHGPVLLRRWRGQSAGAADVPRTDHCHPRNPVAAAISPTSPTRKKCS